MTGLNHFQAANCRTIVILAGIALAALPASVSVAQNENRPSKSRDNSSLRNQNEWNGSKKRQPVPDRERQGRLFQHRDSRLSKFNTPVRDASPRYFPEGEFESSSIDEGFIFINGEFLPGPYRFRSDGKLTLVNDVVIAQEPVDISSVYSFDEDTEDRGRSSYRRNSEFQKTCAEFLSSRFSQSRQILVAFSGSSLKLLPKSLGGNDLLSVLVSRSHHSKLLPHLLSHVGSPEDAAQWSQWINEFRPNEAFLKSAQPIVDRIDAAFEEGVARQAAIRRLENWAYPLTIAGMIMSVFAIGHLMSNPPNGGKLPDEIEMSPEVVRIVTRSLGLVVALSILDLVWTLLASQAGTMRELNPVGGRLIDDPTKLILFKVAMTTLAAGLIFKLRYYRRAQQASWWACLILTLLTVRWLTFNSMLA